MFSLSSCWFGPKQDSGEAMVDEAVALGFGALELGYGFAPAAFPGVMNRVKSGAMAISSVHAYTPAVEGKGGHPELFKPSSTDETLRVAAVNAILSTLSFAKEAGAPIVVLHAGRVEAAARLWLWVHARIMDERAGGFFYRRRLSKMNAAREAGGPAAIDALSRTLDEVLPEFEKAGVRLAIENLPSFDALPSPEEADALVARFSSSPSFALWFDMGHGQVMENAGYGDAAALAKRHEKMIAGVHVHDVVGPGCDHQAPGLGGIDYKRFSFLAGKTLVFEPAASVSRDDLEASVRFMHRVWPGA